MNLRTFQKDILHIIQINTHVYINLNTSSSLSLQHIHTL